MPYGTVNADLMTTSDGVSSSGLYGFKNRIINGAMVIDQRNAGNSGTATAYTVDRWRYYADQASKGTWQQNAGSITPPTGFANYLGFTTGASAYTVGSSEQFKFDQVIEGFNVADLNWGTANAKTITLSFWVRSSLTGTFGGSLANGAFNRTYPFSYTISSANTWTQVSITIAGDTSGTWLTTNGAGMYVTFGLGIGSTLSGTAGAWSGSVYASATGATSILGTANATWYITGVQLEKGSTATSFDYRPYGTELQLAQRYYYRVTPDVNAPFSVGFNASATQAYTNVSFPVVMRITPTAVEQTGTASNYRVRHSGGGTACSSVPSIVNGSPSSSFIIFAVASGLTTGQAAFGESNLASAYLGWSAEL